jgi:hypothetical protein
MNQKILAIALPSEQFAILQQKAIVQQKEVGQLGLEIICNWLRQQTEIEENTASESKDEAVHEVTAERSEQALEAAYREYYADAEDDLRIVRNMRTVQMRAFEKSH